MTEAIPQIRDLATLRAQLLGAGILMGKINVGDDDAPRTSVPLPAPAVSLSTNGWYYYNVNFLPGTGSAPEFGFADAPYASVCCRRSAGNQYGANWYVGGAPDFVQAPRTDIIRDANWLNAFNGLRDYVLGFFGPPGGGPRFALKVKERNPANIADADVFLPVWDVNSQSLVVQYANADGAFADGMSVFISRVKERLGVAWPSINGTWKIRNVVNNTVTLMGYVPGPVAGGYDYVSGGTIKEVKYILVPITQIEQTFFAKRSRGSSLFSVRGRRKTKKSVGS